VALLLFVIHDVLCVIAALFPRRFQIRLRKSSWKNFGLHSPRQAAFITAFSPCSLDDTSHEPVMPQTCFCCVLEAQQVESSAALQQLRRDELAAEMLKVLTRPFMVRCFLLFFFIWLSCLCSFSSTSIFSRPRLLCFVKYSTFRPVWMTRTILQKLAHAC
jgi:hypothetical protein